MAHADLLFSGQIQLLMSRDEADALVLLTGSCMSPSPHAAQYDTAGVYGALYDAGARRPEGVQLATEEALRASVALRITAVADRVTRPSRPEPGVRSTTRVSARREE